MRGGIPPGIARIDLHVHSRFSFDGIMSPRAILDAAMQQGLSAVAITDHNTIEGGLRTLAARHSGDPLVIVGSEVYTEVGDIVGLFLQQEIVSRRAIEVVREIHEQAGIALIPHPYRHHPALPAQVLARLDAVETHNGRVRDYAARALVEIAAPYHLATTGGSDAHLPWELGRAWIEIDADALDGPAMRCAILSGCARPAGRPTPPPRLAILLSKAVKRCRCQGSWAGRR